MNNLITHEMIESNPHYRRHGWVCVRKAWLVCTARGAGRVGTFVFRVRRDIWKQDAFGTPALSASSERMYPLTEYRASYRRLMRLHRSIRRVLRPLIKCGVSVCRCNDIARSMRERLR